MCGDLTTCDFGVTGRELSSMQYLNVRASLALKSRLDFALTGVAELIGGEKQFRNKTLDQHA